MGSPWQPDDPHPDMVPMSTHDVNDLDAVVHALGIEDSHTPPAEAVEELKTEIERLRTEPRELLAAAMIQCSLATGDGDTIEDLLAEMVGQVNRLRGKFVLCRDALAAMVDRWEPDTEGADRRMWEKANEALGRDWT
jgi:hypothetical protein